MGNCENKGGRGTTNSEYSNQSDLNVATIGQSGSHGLNVDARELDLPNRERILPAVSPIIEVSDSSDETNDANTDFQIVELPDSLDTNWFQNQLDEHIGATDSDVSQFPYVYSYVNHDDGDIPIQESSEEDDSDNETETVLNQLRNFVLDEPNFPRTYVTSILKILKSHDCFSDFPGDYSSFLRTPREYIFRDVNSGSYYHFGLESYLKEQMKTHKIDKEIELLVNIDGIPIAKSSGSQLWPILGLI